MERKASNLISSHEKVIEPCSANIYKLAMKKKKIENIFDAKEKIPNKKIKNKYFTILYFLERAHPSTSL